VAWRLERKRSRTTRRRRPAMLDRDYLLGLQSMLSEWASPEDRAAFEL
jgi:hypothetical protein